MVNSVVMGCGRTSNQHSSFPDVQLHIVDAPTELGFTQVRQYHCPSRQQPTWMRRPGIHTPRGGYGFRARSFHSRPGMTAFYLSVPPQRPPSLLGLAGVLDGLEGLE